MNKSFLEYLEKYKDKKIFFWGASLFLEEFLNKNNLSGFNILGIIDKNTDKSGQKIQNYKIFSPEILKQVKPDCIILSIKNNNENIYLYLSNFLEQNYSYIDLCPNFFKKYQEENYSLKDLKQELFSFSQMQFNELLSAQIFNNLIRDHIWLKCKDFIPAKAAATYSFLLILLIILEKIKPQNILEFGLGQTSKITTSYISNFQNNAKLKIIEQDKKWLDIFSTELNTHENIKIIQKNVYKNSIDNTLNDKYEALNDVINNEKFDLIIIDGPISGKNCYPRTNILDLIPQNLANDFIIILDDAERFGEKNTAKLILKKLKEFNIEYEIGYKIATKTQLIITSPKYNFVHFY